MNGKYVVALFHYEKGERVRTVSSVQFKGEREVQTVVPNVWYLVDNEDRVGDCKYMLQREGPESNLKLSNGGLEFFTHYDDALIAFAEWMLSERYHYGIAPDLDHCDVRILQARLSLHNPHDLLQNEPVLEKPHFDSRLWTAADIGFDPDPSRSL